MQARRGRRAVALGGELPPGAARRAASTAARGAAITLLYGVSTAFTMSKKARLALLKFSPEASADPDPSVLGLQDASSGFAPGSQARSNQLLPELPAPKTQAGQSRSPSRERCKLRGWVSLGTLARLLCPAA